MSENISLDTGIQGIRSLIKSLSPKSVIPSDTSNLIECGIDSIQIMRLVGRLRKARIKITFADLVSEPTLEAWSHKISQLASAVKLNDKKKEQADKNQDSSVTAGVTGFDYDLTDVQYAYWIGREDNQELGGVGCHAYLEICGRNIDSPRLDQAFRKLIASHSMLRTIFTEEGKQRNTVENHNEPLIVHDCRSASMEEAGAVASRIREKNSHRKLEIKKGQVIGLELLQYPDSTSRIFFDVDLLVADVRSLNILLQDLASLYAGKDIKAPQNWSFAGYLNREHEENAAIIAADTAYWESRTATLPAGPELPYTGSTGVTPHFTRHKKTIPTEIWQILKEKSRSLGLTPAMTLATAYGLTLSRRSSSKKFIINVPLFNRNSAGGDIEHAVADFTNLLLLECDFSEDLSFKEQAEKIQRQFHADSAHTMCSAVKVLRMLSKNEKNTGLTAPVVFACNLGTNLIDSEVAGSLGNLDYMISQTPQVCLDHQIYEMPDGLMVCFDAVESMFPEGLVDTVFTAYTGLLESLAVSESGFTGHYLTGIPEDQQAVREKVNNTAAPLPELTIAERIFHEGVNHPERIAMYYGDSKITYGEACSSVMKIAGMLMDSGVKAHDRVAVSVPRGPLQIISVLAVLAAGAVYVPVAVTQPVSRKEKIINRAGIRTVLTTEPFNSEDANVQKVRFLNPLDASGCAPLKSPVEVSPDSAAYIIFTSGSTGEPKGVEISHRGAMNTIMDITSRAGITHNDCAFAVSAMDFDLSVFDVFGILGAGGSLVVIDEEERRDASLWLELVHRHHVTVWNSVPVLLDMLLTASQYDERALPLKAVMLSGDWIGLDLPERLATSCGGTLPKFMAMGGATEGSIWSNLFEVTLPLNPKLKSIPYGFPLHNQCYRVVDSLGRDCPDFVPGELLIGGSGVALGYAGAPEITAERFFTENGIRWYHTGDHGRYLPDGCLEFLGRKDHQVKVRGHRIELGEIETALTGIAGVNRAIAVTVGNPPQLAAAIELKDGAELDAAGIKAALTGQVPEYMVPNHLEFYKEMPVSANGKIDRKTIIKELNCISKAVTPEDLPQSDLERKIADIWKNLLKRESITRNDDFFISGGDSLSATRFIQTMQHEKITVEPLPLRVLFSSPTVASICSYIETNNLCMTSDSASNSFEEGFL